MSPTLGEDEYDKMDIPTNWPDHLDAAIRSLNNRILPNLKFSPNELLLGLVVNTRPTPINVASTGPPTPEEVDVQMAYVDQHRFDGYAEITDHASRRKAAFDKKVLSTAPREVIFRAGDLVQVYCSDLDYTFKSERKMEPKFLAPRRIVSRQRNSYKLETLEGLPISGRFSSRRLRLFIPRQGTDLEAAQAAVEKKWRRKEDEADKIPTDERGGSMVREKEGNEGRELGDREG